MNMRAVLRLTLMVIAVFTLTLGFMPGEAMAKKKKGKKGKKDRVVQIESLGIKSMDRFFGEAAEIDKLVRGADRKLVKSRQGLKTSLKVKDDLSLKEGLLEFKSKAGGQVKLGMQGGKPKFTVSEAAPADIRKGVEGLNSAVTNYVKALDQLKDVPGKVAKLQRKSKGLPAKFKEEMSSTSVMDIPTRIKQLKTFKDNMTVVAGLPKRTTKAVKKLDKNMSLLVTTFGGTWPPKLGK